MFQICSFIIHMIKMVTPTFVFGVHLALHRNKAWTRTDSACKGQHHLSFTADSPLKLLWLFCACVFDLQPAESAPKAAHTSCIHCNKTICGSVCSSAIWMLKGHFNRPNSCLFGETHSNFCIVGLYQHVFPADSHYSTCWINVTKRTQSDWLCRIMKECSRREAALKTESKWLT